MAVRLISAAHKPKGDQVGNVDAPPKESLNVGEINLADAPAPVKAAVQKQAGKLLKLESLTEGAKVTYEAQIESAKKKRVEFKFAADGSAIK